MIFLLVTFVNASNGFIFLGADDRGYALCGLYKGTSSNCALSHEFGPEDSPVVFWTVGSEIHLTGNWIWEDEDEDEDDSCCESHDGSAETESVNGDEKEVHATKEEEKKDENVQKKISIKGKRNATDAEIVSVKSVDDASGDEPKKTKRNKRGPKPEEPSQEFTVVTKPPSDITLEMKRWKAVPQNDEGVPVPTPKMKGLASGVSVTDYVIGRGIEPKLGSNIHITYEGYFPDGTLFDKHLKRTKPFKFRKGVGQVVRGLDVGMEGMRVGGYREIFIPSELG
jgi:FKBP-type peptidyl-prolyl cis-trans isomerase